MNYIVVGFIWGLGWVLACILHRRNMDYIKLFGTKEDIRDLELDENDLFLQYMVLFFLWPHYLMTNDWK